MSNRQGPKMNLLTLQLPEHIVERAKAVTGKRTARAAVVALVESSGNEPNASTAASLRAKPGRRDRQFDSAAAAVRFLQKRYR